jgi:uncharacterized membrane protein YtjA (UPF0391 family)
MLQWALVFLGVAFVAAILGFGGVAGSAAGIAQVMCVLFLAMFLVTLTRGWMNYRRSSPP